MRGFFAVLERELVERRLLAVVALVVGLLPLAVPWFSNAPHLNPADIRDGAALAFCMTFTVVVAILLGASVIAGDLAERRLGFYFSRPLSGWAIWGGKIVAAALLAVGGGLLVLLPVLLSGGGIDIQGAWPGRTLRIGLLSLGAFWVACTLFLILAAHAASVMIRARSPWLAVDLVAAAVVGLLLWSARFELLFMRALLFPSFWDVLAVALIFSGLAVAGAIQVVRGRTDPRRGHRALSLTLWGLLLTLAAASQGFAHWMLDASPEDLTHVTEVSSAPSGSWVAFSGPARNRGEYRPHFLFDTASGRYVRRWWGETLFSADGTRAVWLEPAGRSLRSQELVLYHLDLRDPESTPVRTTFSFDLYPGPLALSPRGDRLASIRGGRFLVEDLDRGKILTSIPFPRPSRALWEGGMRFLDSEHVFFLQASAVDGDAVVPGGEFEVIAGAVDLSRDRSIVLRRIATVEGYPSWSVSPDGSRMLLHGGLGPSSRLFDLQTGQEIGRLDSETGAERLGLPEFLADGRIAVSASRRELRIYSRDLVLERSFRFDRILAPETGGQPAPDRLIVAVARLDQAISRVPSFWRILLLDLTTGEVRDLAPKLLPAGSPKSGPRSIGSRLFRDEYGGLVALDPATGETRIIVRGSRPS